MSNGLVHAYGSNQIVAAWRNKQMRKDEHNREMTRIILGQASAGEAVDFAPGNPQYEGIARQFGPTIAKGYAAKNKRIRSQREAENGITYLKNGFDLAKRVPDNQLSQRFIEEGVVLLTEGGISGLDAESINNAEDSAAELKDKTYKGVVRAIEGVKDLDGVTGARLSLAAAGPILGKSTVEQLDQILDSYEKQFTAEEKIKQGKLKEERLQANRMALKKAAPGVAEKEPTFIDNLMEQFDAGRPLDDFAPNEQIRLKKHLGLSDKPNSVAVQELEDWKKRNPGKPLMEFAKEKAAIPQRQIITNLKQIFQIEKPTLQYNEALVNKVGYLSTWAYEAADKAIKTPRIAQDVARGIERGGKSRDQIAVEMMKPIVTNSKLGYPDAILYNEGDYFFWAIPDENGKINSDSVVADKDGWVGR
jgi:hypothetical protein